MTDTRLTRDFTVAVFVVHRDAVILHPHRKLGIWLPPGGHIEPNELPDEAAVREVMEETGLHVELVGDRGVEFDDPNGPLQLVRPIGIQLEKIAPGHEHIDLIYLAKPVAAGNDFPPLIDDMQWVARGDLASVSLTPEVLAWSRRALDAV